MAKRTIWAIVAVFLAWSIMDFILHGLFLRSTYEATANLWRPMAQMNMPLMYFVTFVFTVCFVLIYGLLVGQKSIDQHETYSEYKRDEIHQGHVHLGHRAPLVGRGLIGGPKKQSVQNEIHNRPREKHRYDSPYCPFCHLPFSLY